MRQFSVLLLLVLLNERATGQSSAVAIRDDPRGVRGGLVVSVDPIASRIGASILAAGGNAVDAAIATGFALAVTHPEAGNLGGGGFMVVRLAKTGESFTVDYREKAPRLATRDMFLDERGKVDKDKVDIGWLVVGVPGSPMGLWTAHRTAGRLPWRQLVAPAVALAEDGFVVDKVLHESLKSEEKIFHKMREPARVYMPAGRAPAIGERLRLPDLAATLRRIMDHGPEGFYRGPVAERLDAAMQANGGLVRKEDLAAYQAVVRAPLRGQYRDCEIIAMAPPSSGGVALVEMLNILSGVDLAAWGPNDLRTLHWLTEAMKRAYYDRAKFLGDPDFVAVPVAELLSQAHAEHWRARISERATPAASFGGDILTAPETDDTTHFSVIDGEGNAVGNTTTLEGSYGAKVIAPGTGFLLNNEMHDFNTRPGWTDTKGSIGTPPNLIAPHKRMLSSQTPTIVVKGGKPLLVLGSPGGRTIINTVLRVLVNVVDFGMEVQSAVDAGRLHHQWQPDVLWLEERLGEPVAAELRRRGHVVKQRKTQGDCQAIFIDPRDGLYYPGIDRRRRGGAAGY